MTERIAGADLWWVVTRGDPRDGEYEARPATAEEIEGARRWFLRAIDEEGG